MGLSSMRASNVLLSDRKAVNTACVHHGVGVVEGDGRECRTRRGTWGIVGASPGDWEPR